MIIELHFINCDFVAVKSKVTLVSKVKKEQGRHSKLAWEKANINLHNYLRLSSTS